MKESITKFDLESAFKALDDLDIPVAEKGIKANRPALTEIFSRKSKFESLFEEYYDIGSSSELNDAKEARDAEVAKAKLARIEKIVDLDADSPEDLLTSYVGKYIIQCPQCMTLFYKNQEDVEESEDDPSTVNVNEVCQHCGNESGYTLIGKVGEASADESTDLDIQSDDETTFDETDIESSDEDTTTEDANVEADEAADELNLDSELAELDLEIEDEEPTDKTEEALKHDGEMLVEELHEETDLDVSADEFEQLINSPEFKKPISDRAARTMLNAFSEKSDEAENGLGESATSFVDYEEDFLTDAIYDMMYFGKFLRARWTNNVPLVKRLDQSTYKVTHPKGGASVAVKFDMTNKNTSELNFTVNGKPFKTNSSSEAQDFVLNELNKEYSKLFDIAIDEALKNNKENLEEGIFDKLSRAVKAEHILENAVTDDGKKRFNVFLVIGYTNKYTNDKEITNAPRNNKDLVVGMSHPEVKTKYKDADNIAKGWSMTQGKGPAFIYLAQNPTDAKAQVLCGYFKGKLIEESDMLDKYYEEIKMDKKGRKLTKKGGMDQSPVTKMPASDIKKGMILKLDDGTAEVLNIKQSRFGNKSLALEIKLEDGSTEINNIVQDELLDVLKDSITNESLKQNIKTIIESIENLHETSLESLITNSLVETYKNVAGFRLTSCDYINEAFVVHGNIFFTSGKSRKTSYTFTEAKKLKDNKINLYGLNEKLGSDKQFILTGYTDASGQTLITESFNQIKMS